MQGPKAKLSEASFGSSSEVQGPKAKLLATAMRIPGVAKLELFFLDWRDGLV